jgi:hypothetical protein
MVFFKPLSHEETVLTFLQDYPDRCLVILTTIGEKLEGLATTLDWLDLNPNDEQLLVSFSVDTNKIVLIYRHTTK